MKCPSDEILDAYLAEDDDSTVSKESSAERAFSGVAVHLANCETCSAKIAQNRALDALLIAATSGPTPEHVFVATRTRIENFEHRQRNIRMVAGSLGVAMLLGLATCLQQFSADLQLSSAPTFFGGEPTQPVVDESVSAPVLPEQVSQQQAAKEDPAMSVQVSTQDGSLLVPVSSGSVRASIFFIYPTIGEEVSSEDTPSQSLNSDPNYWRKV